MKKKKNYHEHLDKGDFKVQMPYELLFLNKKTNGAFLLGIGSYFPFELFPFFMDISDYSEDVALVYEIIDDKFDAFISCLNNLKYNDGRFVYFSMDVGAVSSIREENFRIQR